MKDIKVKVTSPHTIKAMIAFETNHQPDERAAVIQRARDAKILTPGGDLKPEYVDMLARIRATDMTIPPLLN